MTKGAGDPQFTPLEGHERVGKELSTAFAKMNWTFSSWLNDKVPEFLWLALLHSAERQLGLVLGKMLLSFSSAFAGTKFDGSHSSIAELPKRVQEEFFSTYLSPGPIRDLLRPLLLFPMLPARDRWLRAIDMAPQPSDWERVSAAVIQVLDHQSQAATDLRWARVMTFLGGDQLRFHPSNRDMVEELVGYPDVGDQRKVRPTVRAMEVGFPAPSRPWAERFWNFCAGETPCRVRKDPDSSGGDANTLAARIDAAWQQLQREFHETSTTTAMDPRHDSAFGFAFFSLGILRDLLPAGVGTTVSARGALRTLAEVHIVFRYLATKDDLGLWRTYRSYGAGQAKLAFLKLDRLDASPEFASLDTLQALANEDIYQEFVSINLGNWAGTDLRKISEASKTKDVYDSFYGWPSVFVHGQWSGVRDAVFTTCLNPLHRLHRVPRDKPRGLENVIGDAARLVDSIVETVRMLFPNKTDVRVAASTSQEPSPDQGP